jgi:hypothetical protein
MPSDPFRSLAYLAMLDLRNNFERPNKTIERTQKTLIRNQKE